ncbi:MAG: plastocyanin/azurin family copper-binding protein [Pseudomonadota bacterium]
MKRNTLLGAVALASLATLSACGGAQQAPAPEATEEAAPVAEATEEAPAEEVAAVPAAEANGTIIEVEMLTRDPDTGRQVFKPGVVKAKVGDTIVFKPTDPTHQSQSIDDMIPAGVTGWEGAINEEVSYVVPAPGIYGYKCNPHYAAGMVGIIVVEGEGMSDNLEAAKAVSHPGLAGRAFEEYFAEAEGMM